MVVGEILQLYDQPDNELPMALLVGGVGTVKVIALPDGTDLPHAALTIGGAKGK